jgi:hypothetical protein
LLWAAPIWFLVRWKNARYRELQRFCRAYLQTEDVNSKASLIENISDDLLRKLCATKLPDRARFEGVWIEDAPEKTHAVVW